MGQSACKILRKTILCKSGIDFFLKKGSGNDERNTEIHHTVQFKISLS